MNNVQEEHRGDVAPDLEQRLQICRTQLRQIETLRKIGSWMLDLDSGMLTWSEGTYRIFALSPDQPLSLDQAISLYPEASRLAVRAALAAAIDSHLPFDLTLPFVSGTDAERGGWIRMLGQCEQANGARRLVGVIEDVTDEKAARDELHDLAYRDMLTGLPNRHALHRLLVECCEAPDAGGAVALSLVDIDDFKIVNETYGHPAGDALLREVAARLSGLAGPNDMVARLGGDEFAIVRRNVDSASALDGFDRALLRAVADCSRISDRPISATASIGVAHGAAGAATADDLFRFADIALYRAKALGRNQVCVYETHLRDAVEARALTLTGVRDALEQGRMMVVYQPIVDLWTGIVRGMEALVRWRHPVRGVLTPADFEAALADPALSVAIDDFVLRTALAQMRDWVDRDVPVAAVNVNLSGAQLRRPDLVERVAELLAANGLPPDRLKLEVLETAFLGRDVAQVAERIDRLGEIGVVVALDDFGTGYASLTHLKRFKVRRIKIDRSFITNICEDVFDRGLVKSMIDLGRNLGIRVTAEGVETAEQLAMLRGFGCDCAQGYLVAPPLPADEIPPALIGWFASFAADLPAIAAASAGHPSVGRSPRAPRVKRAP